MINTSHVTATRLQIPIKANYFIKQKCLALVNPKCRPPNPKNILNLIVKIRMSATFERELQRAIE